DRRVVGDKAELVLCLKPFPGLSKEIGYRAEPGNFIIGEVLAYRRGNCERTKQATVGRLERVAGIGRSTEFAHEAPIRIGRDAVPVGHKRLAACRSSPTILLTEFERLGRLQALRRYTVHEHQLKALRRWIEAVVGADDSAEGRLDVLERLAAEFAW